LPAWIFRANEEKTGHRPPLLNNGQDWRDERGKDLTLEREKQVAFAALDQKEQRLSAFSMAAPSGTSCAPPDCSPARVGAVQQRVFQQAQTGMHALDKVSATGRCFKRFSSRDSRREKT